MNEKEDQKGRINMCKVAVDVTAAIVLLLVGLLPWNAEAAPFAGTTGFHVYSLLEKAECKGENVICEAGKMLACSKGTSQPDCACIDCPPKNIHGCPCRPKTCCTSAHGYVCCQ